MAKRKRKDGRRWKESGKGRMSEEERLNTNKLKRDGGTVGREVGG